MRAEVDDHAAPKRKHGLVQCALPNPVRSTEYLGLASPETKYPAGSYKYLSTYMESYLAIPAKVKVGCVYLPVDIHNDTWGKPAKLVIVIFEAW